MEYIITGIVERGDQYGRTLGFPTANVRAEATIPQGVYAGYVHRKGLKHVAAILIGPTSEDTNNKAEAYILDFDEEIYGETITIETVRFLREYSRFDSEEALIEAIKKDVKNVQSLGC